MKKAAAILLPVLLGLALSTLALLFSRASSVQASPGILYVAPGGTCGGGVANCYATVQAAVDAAAPGDEIRVAAGTYTDVHVRPRSDVTTTGVVTQSVYLTKTLTILGGYNSDFSVRDPAANATILDAQGEGRVLYITGAITPTIEGLRLTGGDASGMDGYEYYGTHDAGGGVYVLTATVTLMDNKIYNNAATYGGGGVFLSHSDGRLIDNQITENRVSDGGGAGVFFYKGAPSLESNQVLSNTSDNLGGGVYIFSTDALLKGNTIGANSANSLGGGLDVASCSPTLVGNIFSGNTAGKGAGAYLWYSRSALTNNVFMDNQAGTDGQGSGLWMGGSKPVLLQTTFASNTGGDGSGIMVADASSTSHSTLVMTNTIISDHAIGISVTAGSSVDLDGVLWYNTPVTVSQSGATINVQHQYEGDPAFAPDGYHLTAGSAAIDKGVPAGVNTDIDGQPRPASSPDLGADEYWAPGALNYIYLPAIYKNATDSP
jgi:hypothetical protein